MGEGMSRRAIVVFGAAEKGQLCTPMHVTSLENLLDSLGHPPLNSEGLACAIQTLLHDYDLIYFRVEEEGFSTEDYIRGLRHLKQKPLKIPVMAITMPGVGEQDLIHIATPICHFYRSILLISEKDLYDYLTEK
jgi:hypothetical protein